MTEVTDVKRQKEINTSEVKAFNNKKLSADGITGAYVVPKFRHAKKGYPEGPKYISPYGNELERKNFYVELTDDLHKPLVTESINRVLYKVPYHSDYALRYERHSADEGKPDVRSRFLVPVTDLQKYDATDKPSSEVEVKSSERLDVNISELTVRDFAALLHRRPVSTKEWVNKLIEEEL